MEQLEILGNCMMVLSIVFGFITLFFVYELGCYPCGSFSHLVNLKKRTRNLKIASWGGLALTLSSAYIAKALRPIAWFRMNCDLICIKFFLLFLIVYYLRTQKLKLLS